MAMYEGLPEKELTKLLWEDFIVLQKSAEALSAKYVVGSKEWQQLNRVYLDCDMKIRDLNFTMIEQKVEKPQGFDIWSEGYRATGESGQAFYHGWARGATLKDACKELARRKPEFHLHFNPESMSFWGCRLFDNETEARRSFG